MSNVSRPKTRPSMKLFLFLLTLISANVCATESLCTKNEIDYISCTLENSKVASICGSPLKNPKTSEPLDKAWIQYRIGKINQIEFIYPDSKAGSIAKFEGNDFHPHGEDHSVLDLRFINRNALYSFELVSSDKLTAGVSAEVEHKLSSHGCRGAIKPSYSESFKELIRSISERNGHTDIFYEFYKKHNDK